MGVVGLPPLRVCRTCGETKMMSDYRRVGERGKGYKSLDCRPCAAEIGREYRRAHKVELAAYDKARAGRYKTLEGLAKVREYGRAWRARNRGYRSPTYGKIYFRSTKEAQRAHSAVRRALESGKLIRPDSCSRCGRGHRVIEAAHHDYAKLLEVDWLCRSCHRTEDAWNPKRGVERPQRHPIRDC